MSEARECESCGGKGEYMEQDPCAGPQWYVCSYCNGTGVQGEVYPCRDDIFSLTYEPCAEQAMGGEGDE